jgi:hypothetical protein
MTIDQREFALHVINFSVRSEYCLSKMAGAGDERKRSAAK